ncbi:FAD-binding oxidoreductase [Bordetella genomosp. 9]|uniref:FAD-binding oxidoreductase n=1 Tax=Bordetella genomosp. 9 TaxID=1416803 RepID=UPI001E5E37BE|nr:FAD-binding oxidoreductase [Bordetella genomosp. 9]
MAAPNHPAGMPSPQEFVAALIAVVGGGNVLTGDAAAPYLTDWRRKRTGRAIAVARPANREEVAALVRLCAAHGVPIVAQGGNTGQVAGATPDTSGRALVLSLARLNRIRAIDADNDTITVEAGCVLQAVQEAARRHNRLFPLSLGAEGSCTIGGNLATNAGGSQVLRYGNARELTLGLEVVTAEGEIWHGLRGLRKDNAGYDLRDLYLGSEGTLGIITAATLRLYPMPQSQHTALVALASLEDATRLLARARSELGSTLTAFEVMARGCLEDVVAAFPRQRLPFERQDPAVQWYALLESSVTRARASPGDDFEAMLAGAWEAGVISDAVIAASAAQQRDFWALREHITLALAEQPYCIKHDISLPISAVADFVRRNGAQLAQAHPGLRMRVFGHLGDGNLHYNLLGPVGTSRAAWMAAEPGIQTKVHDEVVALGGSISAEQGIGGLRVAELRRYKPALELALMRRIKQALDPSGLLNPGKVLDPSQSPD